MRLTSTKSGNFFPPSEHPSGLSSAVRSNASAEFGEGFEDRFQLDQSLFLYIQQFRIANPYSWSEIGSGRITFLLHLGGYRRVTLPGIGERFLDVPCLIAYQHPPDAPPRISRLSPCERGTSVGVAFDLHSPPQCVRPLLPKLTDAITKAKWGSHGFFWVQRPLLPSLKQATEGLFNAEVHPCLLDGFLGAKATEILCLAVNALLDTDSFIDTQSMSREDRLLYARQILEERTCDRLSVRDISVYVGLSRASLTKHFKEYYGCSITDYSFQCRMRKAYQLASSTDTPVKQIAYHAGYSHVSNFCIAFKRQFGVTPSEVRSGTSVAR